jgi:hypothetical protein
MWFTITKKMEFATKQTTSTILNNGKILTFKILMRHHNKNIFIYVILVFNSNMYLNYVISHRIVNTNIFSRKLISGLAILILTLIVLANGIIYQSIVAATPGIASSPPLISNWGPCEGGHLNAFVLGNDSSIWNNPFFNNTWHDWVHTGKTGDVGHPPGITITSAPAAISRDVVNKILDVFATGSDKSIWHLCTSDGAHWAPWAHAGDAGHPPGITIPSAPSVTSWNHTDLHIAARGSDNNVWYNQFTQTGSAPTCNGIWTGWKMINESSSGTVNPKSLTRLDFETGDLSQWTQSKNKVPTSQNNCAEYDFPNHNNALDVTNSNTYPPSTSKYSLQVTLTNNAIIIPGTGSSGERAELKYCDSPGHVHMFKEGTDQWYHWYTMFPSNFPLPGPEEKHPWHVWTQWHTGDQGTYDYGVPIEFHLNGNTLGLRVFDHYYEDHGCYDYTIKCGYLWHGQLTKGIWYDVLIHIKWSTKSDGLVEGRIKLINGNNVTVQPFETYNGYTLNNLANAPIDDKMVFLKQGLYRNPSINLPQILWHDGMVISECPQDTSYDPDTEKCTTKK